MSQPFPHRCGSSIFLQYIVLYRCPGHLTWMFVFPLVVHGGTRVPSTSGWDVDGCARMAVFDALGIESASSSFDLALNTFPHFPALYCICKAISLLVYKILSHIQYITNTVYAHQASAGCPRADRVQWAYLSFFSLNTTEVVLQTRFMWETRSKQQDASSKTKTICS